MTISPGTRLGPYEIVSLLGVGGMGEVFKARDTRLDRTVALKVLPAEYVADNERRLRFEREARAISSLNHPHICALYDIGNQDSVPFLVMEHLEGETLEDRLRRARCRSKRRYVRPSRSPARSIRPIATA
jgi:serine/threonine protein kinase